MNLYRQPHSGSLRRRIEKDNILLFESFTFLPCGYSPCIPLWEHPVKLRDTAGGEGEALIRSLLLRVFLNPSVTMCPLSLYFVWRHILHRVARNGKGRVSPLPHYLGEWDGDCIYPSPLCGVSRIGETPKKQWFLRRGVGIYKDNPL